MQGAAPAPVAQAGVSSPAPAPGAAPASRPQPAEADGELTAADTQAAVQDFREVSGQPDPGIEARPAAQHESPAAATLPNSSRPAGLKKRFPVTPALKTAGLDPRTSLWEPPQSPFGLIEEQLYDNPWKLLLACLLLNKTTGVQVRKVLWKLLALISTPEAAVKADVSQIQDIIQPLGLFRKRALAIQRFSHEFLTKQWVNPMELHGIGQYAADAYYIFCRGEWESVQPTDKDLLRYHEWLKSTGGQGTGLQRDVAPALSPVLDQLNQA
ncbi:hypothetical protein WJX72_001655 [[Myrmecia] bisecta]|uniref:Methyl-CpG-binding domain protein 4 n=1 Tax=[Myrmecia] bisecta TaxID=41462 RepID=A0AAW1Q878_9CHLO